MLKKIMSFYRKNGLANLIKISFRQIYPPKANSFKLCKKLLWNKLGLEIGGPSDIFAKKGLLPIYSFIKGLDNCNFSYNTIWEGQIKNGYTFKYAKNRPSGRQYILDATVLNEIPSSQYDFILSSHVLEHIANPIKALFEWIRAVKDEGVLVIIVPHKDGTFDNKRSITSTEHIIDDYNNNTSEDDLTHLDEILELHDLEKDPGAGTYDQFKARSHNNFENRSLHHHVFNTYSAVELIDYVKLKILSVETILPFHIVIVAKKTKNHNNKDIITKFLNNRFTSPFISDKL